MMPTAASRDDWATPLAALAASLHHLSNPAAEWDVPGVRAAIHKARHRGTPLEVAMALIRLAGRRELTTPALLAEDGPHWGTSTVVPRPSQARCAEYGHEHELAHNCRLCAAEAKATGAVLPGLVLSSAQAAVNVRGARAARAALTRPLDPRELAAGRGNEEGNDDE